MCVEGAGNSSWIIMGEVNILILNGGKVSAEQEGLDLSEEASGTAHPILLETVE